MLAAYRSYLIVFAAGALAGLGGGYAFYRSKVVVETPAAAVRQPDSSLVLRRDPDAHARPAAVIPKGATVERVVHVEVEPRADTAPRLALRAGVTPVRADSAVPAPERTGGSLRPSPPVAPPCPAVGVDLALVRLRDGTQRVVASSKGGTVLDSVSIDQPVTNITQPRALHWQLGALYGSAGRAGAYVGRVLGPFVVEAGAFHGLKGSQADAFAGLAIRF